MLTLQSLGFLLQLGLLLKREAIDDAPAVALVALDPEDWLWDLLRFGESGCVGLGGLRGGREGEFERTKI